MIKTTEWYEMKGKFENGVSISQIAREEPCDRRTARKHVQSPVPLKYVRKKKAPRKLAPYEGYIDERLGKYNLTARKLFEEIKAKGFNGCYTIVKRYVRPLKKQKAVQAEIRYETDPGVQGQVDWKKAGRINVDGVVKTLWCFAMILSFSRTRFIMYTTDTTTATFLKCHLEAFKYFCGYPKRFLYDNNKNVVLERKLRSPDSKWNPMFEDFFRHYGFIADLCKPGIDGAKTKGKVEKMIQYADTNFFCGLEFSSIEELNGLAIQWCNKVNAEVHQTTYEIPFDRLKLENLTLFDSKPVYQVVIHEIRNISRDCYISYHANKYSVPWKYAGCEARLHIRDNKMEVDIGGQIICTHEIAPGQHRCIRVKEHFEGLYKAIRDRNQNNHVRRIAGHANRRDSVKVSWTLHNYPEAQVQERDLKVYDSCAVAGGGGE